jgi:hypothetical protein
MAAIIESRKTVEIILPKNGHIQGQVMPDVYVCVMALDLADQMQAEEVRVFAIGETHPRVYSVAQIKTYLWNHPELQTLKGLGTVGPGPGRANFGTGQHIISDVTTRNGIPIPRQILNRVRAHRAS